MNLTLLKGYPDRVGKRNTFCASAVGPTSYNTTTKDVVASPVFQFYIDAIFPAMTVSGTYFVTFVPSAGGARPTWKAVWWTVSGMTEVTNTTNLSAETVQFGGFGGFY